MTDELDIAQQGCKIAADLAEHLPDTVDCGLIGVVAFYFLYGAIVATAHNKEHAVFMLEEINKLTKKKIELDYEKTLAGVEMLRNRTLN